MNHPPDSYLVQDQFQTAGMPPRLANTDGREADTVARNVRQLDSNYMLMLSRSFDLLSRFLRDVALKSYIKRMNERTQVAVMTAGITEPHFPLR